MPNRAKTDTTYSDDPSAESSVPTDLLVSLEEVTGHTVIKITSRSGGGASREGAELVLSDESGETYTGYLSYDTRRKNDPGRKVNFRREVSVLGALSTAWADRGVRVPRLIASNEDYLATLCDLVQGDANFALIKEDELRNSVASDFMSQLADLHAIDVSSHTLDGFDDPLLSHVERVSSRIDGLRSEHLENTPIPDTLILLALEWLEQHIPPPPDRIVLVHGDAGPANFLYENGQVTAHLDWELVRYGDPMEDLAMLCIRNLFQPFMPLPAAFEAYTKAGGAAVDLDRVRYYRLYNQVGFMISSTASLTSAEREDPAVYGMNLVFSTAHMKVMVESLAELSGTSLAPNEVERVPTTARTKSFDVALNDLKRFVLPNLADQQAAAKAKGLARLVKWWSMIERYGTCFDRQELKEVSQALGTEFTEIELARLALNQAVLESSLDPKTALQLCANRVARETYLLQDAMGTFATVSYPPLE